MTWDNADKLWLSKSNRQAGDHGGYDPGRFHKLASKGLGISTDAAASRGPPAVTVPDTGYKVDMNKAKWIDLARKGLGLSGTR